MSLRLHQCTNYDEDSKVAAENVHGMYTFEVGIQFDRVHKAHDERAGRTGQFMCKARCICVKCSYCLQKAQR